MAIQVADGFSLQSQKPIDARLQFDTVANMKAYAENSLYNGCFAYVIANKTYYTFDSSNTVDSTTGKWREFSGGGGTDENAYHTGDTAETALADADYFPFYDTSAIAKRKTLWSNIKSVLKTYFDTLYSTTKTRGTATSGGTTLSLVNTGDMYNWNTDSVIYCTSSTSASTAAKVATVSRGTFTLVAGAKVCVKFTYSNTASAPTLNVASTGAKNIKYIGTDGVVETPNTWWGAGDIVTFIYDGTQFLMQLTYAMPSMPTLGVINRSDIYSTTEKVVGCHTDGRPLYQRTYSGTLTNTTESGVGVETNIASGTTVKEFVDVKGYVIGPAGANLVLPMVNDNDGTNRFIRIVSYPNGMTEASLRNLIVIKNGYLTTGTSTYVVTAKYTKTTDAANSYNYADENDYSTSEKIIGTWIDGKKIYQRVIQATSPLPEIEGIAVYQNFAIGAIVDKVIGLKGMININEAWCPLEKSALTTADNATSTGIHAHALRTCILSSYSNSFSDSTYKNTIRLSCSAISYGNKAVYVVIQYTKV